MPISCRFIITILFPGSIFKEFLFRLPFGVQLLRVMLHKKINPQNSYRASSATRYLDDKQMPKKGKDDETQEKTQEGCKWVKTDSECKDASSFQGLEKLLKITITQQNRHR